jgi:hypothetical protein
VFFFPILSSKRGPNVPSSNCNHLFLFFTQFFPSKGRKAHVKTRERKKNRNPSARTKEKGRAFTGGSARREGQRGAWSLSSRQSPSQAKALPSSSAAQVSLQRHLMCQGSGIARGPWQPAMRVPGSRARFPGSVLGADFV